MKRVRLIALFIISVMMIVLISACGKDKPVTDAGAAPVAKGKIVIGGKDFTEQLLLAKITSIYLKEQGYTVEEASNMGSTVVRNALENGQIDMYWEYTGTALVVYQKQKVETDTNKTYDLVKAKDKENKLVWLDKADLNNTYAIMMLDTKAKELNIKTISDLAAYMNKKPDELKFASNAEFYAREDGVKGLEKKYDFTFPAKNVVKMDSGLLYNALKDGQVNVSVGFATDGRIKGFKLVVLDDDKQFFPAYNAAPVVRQAILDKDPGLAELLNKLPAKLTAETMMNLNYTVDVEHKDVAEVSRNWLVSEKLIK
jgi:osmoprotectant transport system substrate-binding protein